MTAYLKSKRTRFRARRVKLFFVCYRIAGRRYGLTIAESPIIVRAYPSYASALLMLNDLRTANP